MNTPSLGTMIRARRLGWGLSNRHGAFIRMSNDGGEQSMIELCPINAIPSKKIDYHRCWWDTPEILQMVPWLAMIRKVKKYIAVTVNEHGQIVR
jgi:hypothetical protein